MQTQTDPEGEAKVGDTLLYRLRQQDNPVQSDRLWYGRIIDILVSINDNAQKRYYIVQSREYPDCDEVVYPEQVAGFERL